MENLLARRVEDELEAGGDARPIGPVHDVFAVGAECGLAVVKLTEEHSRAGGDRSNVRFRRRQQLRREEAEAQRKQMDRCHGKALTRQREIASLQDER
jgi:hypothetical protein